MLSEALRLRSEGFAVHWLRPRSKAPISAEWSTKRVPDAGRLTESYRDGYNLGVRLGGPSEVGGGYLHAIDIDIRFTDLADEAWARLRDMLPGIDLDALPCVASGSGGESRHLYFITDRPFLSKKFAVSDGKHRGADGKWHYDWELELYGTGKQVALPPSIHPDTGKPYRWEREFDFQVMSVGIAPEVPAASVERLSVAEESAYAFEAREPLTFKPGQLDRTLDDVPDSCIDDYHQWVLLGQALHHQFGGADEGFELWFKHSARSTKFDDDRRALLRKWRGFGRNRRKPATMATVVEWAQEGRAAAMGAMFDDLDAEEPEPAPPAAASIVVPEGVTTDFDDILCGAEPAEPPKSDLELLGGADDEAPDELPWTSLLDLNEEGALKPTLHNVTLMVANDPRLVGLAQLNEFTHETMQRTAPGIKPPRRKNAPKPTIQLEQHIWSVQDTLNGELWSDDRDFDIRKVLEAPKTQGGYGAKVSDRDLKSAVTIVANRNRYHPVREYLESTTWDGTERVETLFIDYLGAPNTVYTRSVARLMLVGAVARIFEPGCKFDYAVILEGLQGRRKSTFIQALGRNWFAELDGDFHDQKQMVELMQGAWIMEIPELSGFNRGDVRSIKAFMSRQEDRARLAYARRAGSFPRQCIFIGSTNDREYLKDDSGGRRFWPMLCEVASIDVEHLQENVDQVWAEALVLYRGMRAAKPVGMLPLYLTDPVALAEAERLQESRRMESADDGWMGRIADWLESPIVTGSMDDDFDDGRPRYRNETCLMEIWFDCLGQLNKYQTADGNMLARIMSRMPGWETEGLQHRFSKWGKQRVYRRAASE